MDRREFGAITLSGVLAGAAAAQDPLPKGSGLLMIDNEGKWKVIKTYVFEPQPDITAYELAVIVSRGWTNIEALLKEYENMARHFKEAANED